MILEANVDDLLANTGCVTTFLHWLLKDDTLSISSIVLEARYMRLVLTQSIHSGSRNS